LTGTTPVNDDFNLEELNSLDANARSRQCYRLLNLACKNNNPKLIKQLHHLKTPLNVCWIDDNRKAWCSAIQQAASSLAFDALKVLIKYKMDPNAKGTIKGVYFGTPLYEVIRSYNENYDKVSLNKVKKIVCLLLKHEASMTINSVGLPTPWNYLDSIIKHELNNNKKSKYDDLLSLQSYINRIQPHENNRSVSSNHFFSFFKDKENIFRNSRQGASNLRSPTTSNRTSSRLY